MRRAERTKDFFESYTSSLGVKAAPEAQPVTGVRPRPAPPPARAPMPTLSIDVDFSDIENIDAELAKIAARQQEAAGAPEESGVRVRFWCSEED